MVSKLLSAVIDGVSRPWMARLWGDARCRLIGSSWLLLELRGDVFCVFFSAEKLRVWFTSDTFQFWTLLVKWHRPPFFKAYLFHESINKAFERLKSFVFFLVCHRLVFNGLKNELSPEVADKQVVWHALKNFEVFTVRPHPAFLKSSKVLKEVIWTFLLRRPLWVIACSWGVLTFPSKCSHCVLVFLQTHFFFPCHRHSFFSKRRQI